MTKGVLHCELIAKGPVEFADSSESTLLGRHILRNSDIDWSVRSGYVESHTWQKNEALARIISEGEDQQAVVPLCGIWPKRILRLKQVFQKS